MSELQSVPFAALVVADEINARAGKGKDGLEALAASIDAKGLIQPLVVRPTASDKFEVIDGRRRHQALGLLVKAKKLERKAPIPVIVRSEDDTEALETSLAANLIRLPMHPVDQHEVFARLVGEGYSEADVASRFGLAERTVKQHLALGRLAPEVRKAWRAGKIDADTAKAFTLAADDPLTQARVLASVAKSSGGRISAWAVRNELASGDLIRVDDDDVEMVGLEAYIAAGGTIKQDLFEDAGYIADPAVLKQVVDAHIAAIAAELVADGWAWAAHEDDLAVTKYSHEPVGDNEPTAPVFTAAEAQRLDALAESGTPAALRERTEIQRRGLSRAWPAEIKAVSGCILDHWSGEIEITWAVAQSAGAKPQVRPQAAGPHEPDDADQDAAPPVAEETEPEAPRLSGALTQSLTETLTVAAAETLATAPLVALRCAVATLESWGSSPVHLSASGAASRLAPDRFGREVADRELSKVLADLDAVGTDDLLLRLARAVASALDLVAYNSHAARADDVLARLDADLLEYHARHLFDAEGYFKRVPIALIAEALTEMTGEPPPAGRKKTELVALAVARQDETGWLPPLLRHPSRSEHQA